MEPEDMMLVPASTVPVALALVTITVGGQLDPEPQVMDARHEEPFISELMALSELG